jgi:hypothetical protein
MGQPVEKRGGHFGVAEDARPFGEGEICGDDDGGAFVKTADQMEEQLAAGWRLRLSESRDVPLGTGELNVLVAIPSGRKCQLRFRVAAEIEIQTAVDRLLTHLFVRDSRPGASGDYQFP